MKNFFLFLLTALFAVNAFAYEKQTWNYETGAKLSVGSSGDYAMDIYYPETGEAPYPVLIYVGGNAWQNNNYKTTAYNEASSFLEYALQRGYAVVCPNNRNGGVGSYFPAPFHDARAVIRFLHNNGEGMDKFPRDIDTSFIAFSGYGLGSFAAILMTTRRNVNEFYDWDIEGTVGNFLDKSSAVDAVADFSCLTAQKDYVNNATWFPNIFETSGDWYRMCYTVLTAATWSSSKNWAPTIMIHCLQLVKTEDVTNLYNILKEPLGDDCELNTTNLESKFPTDNATHEAVMNFLDRIRAQKAEKAKESEPVVKALTGRFSVSDDEHIIFAQGNLQYKAKTDQWCLANNQYDMIGAKNANASSTYSGWIDLFGFATSGVAAKPWETSTTNTPYALPNEITTTIAGTDYDWLHYNTLLNDGGFEWRLLSAAEWDYLLNTRTDAADLQGQALVNNVKGYILLPDDWTCPTGLSFTKTPLNYTTNVYTLEQWEQMETAGAVFLPAAGNRYGTDVNALAAGIGYYWTGDLGESESTANVLSFAGYTKAKNNDGPRCQGHAVRPVRSIKKYTVTFVNYDGTELQSGLVEDGATPAYAGETPAKSATAQYTYTFNGWTPDIVAATAAATYTATYSETVNKYTVTFVDSEDKTLKTEEVEYGKSATAPDVPFVDGYHFTAWDKAFDNITADLTVKAQYAINTYTVTFIDWDEKELKSENVEHGSAATAPVDPTREGYTFTGWDKAFDVVKSDLTVTALYEEVATVYFTVTYYDWDMKVLGTEQVEEGHDAKGLETDPEREGYTFTGWSKSLTNITSDLSVQAQYEVAKVWYTVTYYDWDLTVLGTEKVEEGHDAKGLETDPEREGYDFTGWSKPLTNITSDLSVQAQYEEKKVYFTVTYYDWDLTVLGTEKVEEGHDAKGLETDPEREGYDFTGWSKPLTNITSDLSVQAQYEKKEPTALDNTETAPRTAPRKFIENGVLYIYRNGILYTPHGTRLD